jgi:Family of unknown function (DUF6188)
MAVMRSGVADAPDVVAALQAENCVHAARLGRRHPPPGSQSKPVRPGPGIDLLFQSATGLAVEGLGSLTLTFGDGSQLTVHPHDQYESWELYGEGI